MQALKKHPGGPPEIRVGLAQCLFRMGKFKQAEAAFRRTLQCAPGCGPALLGLAITSFYKNTDKYVQFLKLTYRLPDSPCIPSSPVAQQEASGCAR